MPNLRELKAPVSVRTYRVPCPFWWSKEQISFDRGTTYEDKGWVPGVVLEEDPHYGTCSFANGMGMKILKVLSIHRPGGKYPARVFYVRTWVDPDGREFGKTDLKIKTIGMFKAYELKRKDCFDDIDFCDKSEVIND